MRRLVPRLERYGEFLPLLSDQGEFFLLNILVTIDALDWLASDVLRFENGDVMDIERHVFLPQMLNGLGMFRLPLPRAGWTYITDECAAIFEDDRSGVVLKPVWSARVE